MTRPTLYATLMAMLVLLYSCSGTKDATATTTAQPEPPVQTTEAEPEVEVRELEPMDVTAPPVAEMYNLPRYNPSAERLDDLLHTKLELRFDWDKQHVIGQATIKATPMADDRNQLVLDAKGFDIKAVRQDSKTGRALTYTYEDMKLTIDLGRTYQEGQEYTVYIDYVAKPNELPVGGSAAITSDKGLYFINPLGEDPNKPRQIWTQGETESNSKWFPTIDKPNERMTQEMYVTVQDRYKVLSNGVKLSSKKNADGTRTDYYKMDKPHAPYLFMLAIGEFAVVQDEWEGIGLGYWVEPEYRDAAKNIFSNTPEMLTFFSDLVGYKYPWSKYDQVVVRDYVSGAMENTTGVIFGDFVQKTNKELIDNHNERIVAHEMFHHWFGDLVTCESWANLTMNEGFANYSEYLWFEHRYGKKTAAEHMRTERAGYFASAQQDIHPLIHFAYENREDMFDAHSYNKGGAILHMLRHHLGDKVFFDGLQRYLRENEYTAVEAHDLRLALEDESGKDLNWFFNQWFFSAGHPVLDVDKTYSDGKLMVTVEQRQEATEEVPAIFVLPFAIDIYTNGVRVPMRKEVMMTERKQTFTFDVAQRPAAVVFDADDALLAQVNYRRDADELVTTAMNAPTFAHQIDALEQLTGKTHPKMEMLLKQAMKDESMEIRRQAIGMASFDTYPSLAAEVRMAAEGDKDSRVRAAAIAKLGKTGDAQYMSTAKKAIDDNRTYREVSAGLSALVNIDEAAAMQYASRLENNDNSGILLGVGRIYAKADGVNKAKFYQDNLLKVQNTDAIEFYALYAQAVAKSDNVTTEEAIKQLKDIAINEADLYRRFSATRALVVLRGGLTQAVKVEANVERQAEINARLAQIMTDIDEIKLKEQNSQLKAAYQQF